MIWLCALLAAPLAAPAPARTAAPAPARAPAAPAPARSAAPEPQLPALAVSLSAETSWRKLSFRDRLTPQLAGWTSGALPGARIAAELFPAAGRLPVLDQLGAYGSYARSLTAQTLTAEGALAFDTQQIEWDAGLQWRSRHFGVSFGYASLRADFGGPHLPGVLLPSGTVQWWRPGVSARLPLGRFFEVGAGAAYLLIARHNALGPVFPRQSEAGVEALAHAAAVFGRLSVRLSGRYTRFFSSLHPLPYDPYIAGGALDEVLGLDLSCVVRL